MERQVKLKVSMAGPDVLHKPGDVLSLSEEAAEAWKQAGLADILPADGQAPSGAAAAPPGTRKKGRG